MFGMMVDIGIIGKDVVASSFYIQVTLTGTNQWRTHYTLYRMYVNSCPAE